MKTNFYTLLLMCVFFSIPTFSPAQAQRKQAMAILDLMEKNAEVNDAELFSATHIARVSGIPYIVTNDITVAQNYAVILSSSKLEPFTFTIDEKNLIVNYVNTGGVFITPSLKDPDLFSFFGVAGYEYSQQRYTLTWNTANQDPAFRWIDEPEEKTIVLGNIKYDSVSHSRGYTLAGAKPMAYFEDNSVAATKNLYGNGYNYVIGVTFKDMIERSQLNLDYDAQRAYSNSFEPTMDALILYIKGIFLAHVPYAAYKHTSPYNSKSVLMITHDVDATTSMQYMGNFLRLEQRLNVPATYFITTHYVHDKQAKDFFNPFVDSIRMIDQRYHQHIASHSVGHFPDFFSEILFPEGAPGNTMQNYQPYFDGSHTTGGTVYGECEVSKNLLESATGLRIRSYRSGDLAYNDKMNNVMEALGYQFNASNSANNVLTNFPFQGRKDRYFYGELSKIWEIPMTISDVFYVDPISATNYMDKVNIWTSVIGKLANNNAPCVLLIHPNRDYKISAEQAFLQQLPEDIMVQDYESFGDFWIARDTFSFSTSVLAGIMTITIPDKFYPLDPRQSIIIENGQMLSQILVRTESGIGIPVTKTSWTGKSVILHTESLTGGRYPSMVESRKTQLLSEPFPNPFSKSVNITFATETDSEVLLEIYEASGKKIKTLVNEFHSAGDHSITWDGSNETGYITPRGIYFCELKVDGVPSGMKRIVYMP